MKQIKPLSIFATAALASGLLLGGCSPSTDAERAYRERRRDETHLKETIRQSLDGADEESTAIQLVKQAPAPEGEGTTEAWLDEQIREMKGDVLFPRWQGHQRGHGKYEVWFSYTFMQQSGAIDKQGYSWTVDVVLKIVNEPRALTAKELDMRTSRYFRSRQAADEKVQLKQD